MLGKGHTVVAQEICVDEVTVRGVSADVNTTLSVELAIESSLYAHVCVVTIAV